MSTPFYVTLAAAKEYADAIQCDPRNIEYARKDLTQLLLDAKPNQSDPLQYRARSRSSGLDVSIRVVEEDGLLLVVHVHVRNVNVGGRRR